MNDTMPSENVIIKSLMSQDIIGMDVYSRDGERIGYVYDISVKRGVVIGILVGYEKLRPADAINLAKVFTTLRKKKLIKLPPRIFVRWENVSKIKDEFIVLKQDEDKVRDSKRKGVFIAQYVLDEQLVDKKGHYMGRADERH